MIDEEQIYKEFERDLIKALSIYELIKDKKYPALDIFIKDRVWESLVKYNRMEQTTKEKFFESLYNNVSVEEYSKGLEELWDIDHTYMDNAIRELEKMTIQRDFKDAEMYGDKKITLRSIKLEHKWRNYTLEDKELYELTPGRDFKIIEERYVNRHIKLYKTILNRYKDSKDKARELANFLPTYEKLDKTIPYFSHSTGEIIRYVDVGTYNSMLYNVNLTRSAWNRAIYDAKLLDNHLWYLPAHPYACPSCAAYQGRVYTDDKTDKRYPLKEVAIKGGVGHPNCKHVWVSYWSEEQIQSEKYDGAEWEEKYKKQQKIQSLELEKSRLLANRRIYKELGQQDLVDRTTKRIKNIREKIKTM